MRQEPQTFGLGRDRGQGHGFDGDPCTHVTLVDHSRLLGMHIAFIAMSGGG